MVMLTLVGNVDLNERRTGRHIYLRIYQQIERMIVHQQQTTKMLRTKKKQTKKKKMKKNSDVEPHEHKTKHGVRAQFAM